MKPLQTSIVLLALILCALAVFFTPATGAALIVAQSNTPVPTVTAVPPMQGPPGGAYSPDVTGALLRGTMIAPSGFDQCMTQKIGQQRLDTLRTGLVTSTGQEKDTAAQCLQQLQMVPETLELYLPDQVLEMLLGGRVPAPPGTVECLSGMIGQARFNAWVAASHSLPADNGIVELAMFCLVRLKVPPSIVNLPVRATGSSYMAATGIKSGFFKPGQAADLLLSGIDFNNSGGSLSFNCPGGIASDGQRLLLADRQNNRVLIWNRLPQSGTDLPNLVLGQPDSVQNEPGNGRDKFDWPVGVEITPNGRVVVADTYNDRLLIWNTFPTRNQQPADLVLSLPSYNVPGVETFSWPWGVWTDGTRLIATATSTGQILIWNTIPSQDNQRPDVVLRPLGTPRQIISNGTVVIVGNHNAPDPNGPQGNHVWLAFPTRNDQPYDFFMSAMPGNMGGYLKGDFAPDGKLVTVGSNLYIWNSSPNSADTKPSLVVRGIGDHGQTFEAWDDDAVIANGRLFFSSCNAQRVFVYNSIPTRPDQLPDFAIGSPSISTNDALENKLITNNPGPVSNGTSLFVASDYRRQMYVWKRIPDQSGALADFVYSFPFAVSGIALRNETLTLAGDKSILIWKKLPLNGERPDLVLQNRIGNVQFPVEQNIPVPSGVALDDRYFYLSDKQAGKIYVWEGIPTQDSNPKFILDAGCPVGRLSSDGKYLAATCTERGILLYKIVELGTGTKPTLVAPSGAGGITNLPEGAIVADGHLFVADTVFNRVLMWSKIEDAIANKNPDVILGTNDYRPEIGKDKLFWPGYLSFDGQYLWVGEFKFSNRLLRFSVSP